MASEGLGTTLGENPKIWSVFSVHLPLDVQGGGGGGGGGIERGSGQPPFRMSGAHLCSSMQPMCAWYMYVVLTVVPDR